MRAFALVVACVPSDVVASEVPQRKDDACVGFLDHVRPVAAYWGPAFRVDGWAFSRADHERVAPVAMVDRNGIVVGLATGGFSRTDAPRKSPEVSDPSTGFVGHMGELGGAGGRVTAFAVLAGGHTACELDRSARLKLTPGEGERLESPKAGHRVTTRLTPRAPAAAGASRRRWS